MLSAQLKLVDPCPDNLSKAAKRAKSYHFVFCWWRCRFWRRSYWFASVYSNLQWPEWVTGFKGSNRNMLLKIRKLLSFISCLPRTRKIAKLKKKTRKNVKTNVQILFLWSVGSIYLFHVLFSVVLFPRCAVIKYWSLCGHRPYFCISIRALGYLLPPFLLIVFGSLVVNSFAV